MVRASHQTQYGLIAVHWKLEECRLTLAALVPPNTSATLSVPVKDARKAAVHESGKLLVRGAHPVEEVAGVTFTGIKDDWVTFEVQAGHYQFVVEGC